MPARNSGISFIWSASLFAWLSNWPMLRFAETQTPALNEARAISACCDSRSLGIVVGNVRRDPLQRLRVHLGRVEHVLGVLGPRQPRLRRRGPRSAPRSACSMRSRAKLVVIGGPLVALDRVGVGELLQRRQVRDARHGHEVAGRRVVAEGQERRAGRPAPGRRRPGRRTSDRPGCRACRSPCSGRRASGC